MRWKQFFVPAKNMSVEEARQYMAEHKEGDYTLLDVRQPKEYDQDRITGGRLVPLPQLTARLEELDKEKPLIVY